MSPSIQSDFGLEVAQKAKTLLGTRMEFQWIDQDQSTNEYINYWFSSTQREQIRALLAASSDLRGQRRNLVSLALSRIIVTKSKGASLAADTSHSRPHRVRADNDFDVLTGFTRSFDRLLCILKNSPVRASGRVRRGDARTLRGVKPASVDAVITSPPYMNAIDYLRGHKLALVWLGYATLEIRKIKSLGVGAPAQHQRRESNRLNEMVRIASVGELSPGTERVVKRYVYDMMACFKQTYRVLRPGGYAVYVVSNSRLGGAEVDTAKLIVEIASEAGLQLEESYVRDIPREHRYLPPPQATANPQLAMRMRTESVLRFQKKSDRESQ